MGLTELSNIFKDYRIYPQESFKEFSPLKVFQRVYPESYYSLETQELLKGQKYTQNKRASDLPWWGKDLFKSNGRDKVMIVSQYSLSREGGGVVFWSHLYDVKDSKEEYDRYGSLLGDNRIFSFNSWNKANKQFKEWNIDLDNCYITDAVKVYKDGSFKDRDFDYARSRELLIKEIELCKADLVVLLGGEALKLLFPDVKYGDIVESGEYIYFNGVRAVVSPFIIGQGHTQANYKKRLEKASELIKEFTLIK